MRDFYGHEKNIPITSLIIKAAAMLLKEAPKSHRVIISSLFGPRIIEFSKTKVNVPILLEHNGKQFLSAIIIENAEKKGPQEIQKELRNKVIFDKNRFPICYFASRKSNNILNRWILRGLYFLAYRCPSFYKLKGGGISVSAFSRSSISNRNIIFAPMGPTALSFGLSGLDHSEQDQPIIKLGIGYNHTALLAVDAIEAMAVFSDILSGRNQNLFKKLVSGDTISKSN